MFPSFAFWSISSVSACRSSQGDLTPRGPLFPAALAKGHKPRFGLTLTLSPTRPKLLLCRILTKGEEPGQDDRVFPKRLSYCRAHIPYDGADTDNRHYHPCTRFRSGNSLTRTAGPLNPWMEWMEWRKHIMLDHVGATPPAAAWAIVVIEPHGLSEFPKTRISPPLGTKGGLRDRSLIYRSRRFNSLEESSRASNALGHDNRHNSGSRALVKDCLHPSSLRASSALGGRALRIFPKGPAVLHHSATR